jgi:hypothetical protein
VTALAVRDVLAEIAANAAELDRVPAFPTQAFDALREANALTPPATHGEEWGLVRAVAKADGSVGRIFEGHLNGYERLTLDGLDPADHLLGVWGADPLPDEGTAAYVEDGRLHGEKVFCSGAGGLDRALVIARGELVLVALEDDTVEIDTTWYRSHGMRASESHRVVFHGAPVLAVLGGPGELGREPWFGRDAIRTTATWAGLADAATAAAHDVLGPRAPGDDLAALALGRIDTHAQAIDLWMAEAARLADGDPELSLRTFSVRLREAVARAAQAIADEALRAAGSRPLATGHPLDRAARDLRVFLLQHRLDPMLVRAGREAAEA